jgi:hypothetical protein
MYAVYARSLAASQSAHLGFRSAPRARPGVFRMRFAGGAGGGGASGGREGGERGGEAARARARRERSCSGESSRCSFIHIYIYNRPLYL